MNILHAINSTNPAGGGPIESIVQADRALRPRGHESEIVCLDAPGAPWLKAAPLTTHATGPVFSRYRYSPRFAPWIRANATRFDCVIVHGIWLYPSLGTRRALRETATPFFIYTHGMLDPAFRSLFPVKHAAKALWWKLAEHRAVRDARAVFFTCEEERRLAHASFKPLACNEAIVPYCVGEPPGEPVSQKEAFVSRFPGLRDKRIVLFLSRIHPKKGCDTLLRAFATVAADFPDAHLVVAGPDSVGWAAQLKDEAARLGVGDRITWTGMLTGDLKWGAFRCADVFALPSHQENFGIAVVEALACGVPVAISDRINIWREIEEDGAGVVHAPDAAGTANALRAALGRSDADKMRRDARSCFERRFRADSAAENLLNVLHRHGVGEHA